MFILTEDQGAQMGYVGTPGMETPHVDSLARSGVCFNQAFVACPVCSASKAAPGKGIVGRPCAHGSRRWFPIMTRAAS